MKEYLPEELTPTVSQLITILQVAAAPETKLQDREGVIESAEELVSTLTVIDDPSTPGELREQLIALVKQVTSTLEVGHDPEVPPAERSTLILVVKRTTSVLGMIRDPETSQELRVRLVAIVEQVNYAMEKSPEAEWLRPVALPVSASADWIQDPDTPPEEQEKLAEITHEVSASMKKSSDAKASSPKGRAGAPGKDLEEQTARMKEQQEEAASAQDRPDAPLSKAAVLCTNAIFESAAEHELSQSLKDLVPKRWDTEGVKDFWKAEEQNDDLLDILAQLRNDEHTHAPIGVAPLITELADLVPRSELFGTLGKSALYCQKTASYLDEEGITAGSWLAEG